MFGRKVVQRDMSSKVRRAARRGFVVFGLSTLSMACLALGGCRDKDLPVGAEFGDPCSPTDETPCVEGLVCEARAGGSGDDAYICAGPVEIHGMVIDALEETPIANARIIALDDTGAPVSDVAVSDADGRYVLPIAIARDTDGNPATALTLTLSGSALDYQIYPSGVQPAFPVSTATAQTNDDDPDDYRSIIENASTTVALIPLDGAGGFTVSGRVEAEADSAGGTLIVAEGPSGTYTIADRNGAFTLFNVTAGTNTIRGYLGGLQIIPETLEVDADVSGVILGLSSDGLATVNGSVNIVDAPGGSMTSVVLIPSSVFSEVFEFGPVPFGLRAPEPGVAANVSSAWSIPGVPAGTYKIIASLENDGLVRDPDTGIAGTEIVEITVGAGETLDVPTSFKVTGALAVYSPGADGPEEVSGTPVFVFEDDASEERYVVVVHDALGNEVWRDEQIPAVTGSETVTVEYGGPPLKHGMYYRFQATSWRMGSALSRTEDLRGVFVYD
jgi:hypothetical protein